VVSLLEKAERPGQKPVKLAAIIEGPQGLAEAYSIARAHPRLEALMFGAEDYTAGIGAQRTKEGSEIFTARTLVVNAAAGAGIQPIDTVFTDVNDEEGLTRDTLFSKQLGFTGKAAVNPRQVKVINSVFSPSPAEIDWAQRAIRAARKAEAEGSGVVSLDGKMIDAPIVNRAQRVMHLARMLGLAKEAAE
jgi:citrate lyase subunit beta/citryl-CoA lyase